MSVIFVRHGATALNADGTSADRIRGWLDVPLSPQGRKQAASTASKLADTPDAAVTHIFSSDLSRAADTAKTWGKATQTPVTLHKQLRPWNLGNLAGKPSDAVNKIIQALVAHPDEPAPGNGETFHQFLRRYLTFVMPLVRSKTQYGVVAHLRNVKALEAALASHMTNPRRSITDIHLPTWNAAPKVKPAGAVKFTLGA